MAEEGKQAVEAKEAAPEAKQDIDADEVDSLRQRLQEAEAIKQRFKAMNDRYLNDPRFKEQFDAAWEGKKMAEEIRKVESSIDNDLDPVSMLKNELGKANESARKLQERLDMVEGTYVHDKTTQQRQELALKYEDAFMELASRAGYEPGSEGYDFLFTKAEKEGYNIAKSLGVNLFEGYHPKIVQKAFNAALDKLKKAGFDDAWQKRQQALRESQESKRREREQSDGPSLSKFFTKEVLKERGGYGKAMEAAFAARFPNAKDMKF